MDKVLIDTDVILDFFFDRQPFAEYAAQVMGLCEAGKIKGYASPVIYSNVYYLLRQTASHEKVIDKLKQLLMITDVLLMDKEVVSEALNSGFKDFEDSLQNFAAMKHGEIDVILTRNVKDFSKSEIGVLTPESYIKSIIANT
ncbi:MAG: PIN domain-containing protein [Bacteroidetes bacterium]|jgi:predicted nucleic acid-binding protein|nr:PIN domain-containing protein [Bacteroidota bacterium]MBU1578334.1 PIN domain-containing protein [Bacteroidota bacterium]MBU2465987.1 PIN domain-containing protein [Bacteroidota bacterium]MBU2556743.1 PIN domain-containing protein [Bacteroidota bacterium]MDA3943473.1 PIN domain-containing protein [Bacteroidota bacterium]